jgi:hypothetical protein
VTGHEFTHAVQFQWWAVSLVNAVPFGDLLEITWNAALSSLPMIATPIGDWIRDTLMESLTMPKSM